MSDPPRGPATGDFPEGVTYLARTDCSGELPPIHRVSVADGLVTGEHYDPQQDAWVDSVEIRKLRMGMSDHDVVEITPRLAEEIVERWRAHPEASGNEGALRP